MGWTLVTGASSGIGRELCFVAAERGCDVVAVARSGDKLQSLAGELRSQHSRRVEIVQADLARPEQVEFVFSECAARRLEIDQLINNAGIGDFGLFAESAWPKTEQMIDLNIKALTRLCHLFLPPMIARGAGRIMNVASTAAFQPGPTMAVYYATKAYVLHFSEALSNEVRGTGVTVTALCPGATESGFQSAAAMEESSLVKGRKLPNAREVAEFGYDAMLRGRMTVIHGWKNFLMAAAVRFSPRALVPGIVRRIQDKQ